MRSSFEAQVRSMESRNITTRMKLRRAIKRALVNIPPVFTLAMLLGLAWDVIFHDVADYEDAFSRAIYAAVAIPVAFSVLRWKDD